MANLAKVGAHRLLRKVREDLHGALLDNRVVVLELGHQGALLLMSPRDTITRHHKARLGKTRTQGNISWTRKTTTIVFYRGLPENIKKRAHVLLHCIRLPLVKVIQTKRNSTKR